MHASRLWTGVVFFLVLHALGSLLAWSRVPDRIPIHFSFGGTPDVWAAKSPAAWFGPWLVSTVVAVVVYLATRQVARDALNGADPSMGEATALTRRAALVRKAGRHAAACALNVAVVFIGLQTAIFLAALGLNGGQRWYLELSFWLPVVAVVYFGIQHTLVMQKAFRT